ncbi:MAG: hypothetical protein DHS20C14_16000 [Phycisphaeraceae bacterium]|nr:MAG: hypothetical protein DHS20C14_16000 [Phycisphaeraceae bacterium]
MAKAKSFEDMDLPGIAVHMKWVLALIGAYVLLIATNIALVALAPPGGAVAPAIGLAFWVLWLGFVLASIVAGMFLMLAMRMGIGSIVLWSILMLPFNFLVLIAMYSQASTILKVLGVKSGFFGVSRADRERLMPGRCRRCGYDRSGLAEMLAACPECARVPIVW